MNAANAHDRVDAPNQAGTSFLAMIIIDSACNVKLSSFDQGATEEKARFLAPGGARLRADFEAVVAQLVAEHHTGPAGRSRLVSMGGGRNLRFSPLASRDGDLYAVVVEREAAYDRVGRAVERFKLTRRQSEVLTLVLEGASAGEIADQLSISEYTAQGYIKALLSKTSSRNRASMVARVLDWRVDPRRLSHNQDLGA